MKTDKIFYSGLSFFAMNTEQPCFCPVSRSVGNLLSVKKELLFVNSVLSWFWHRFKRFKMGKVMRLMMMTTMMAMTI